MSKSRGVLLVLLLAGALWAISLTSWQAGVVSENLGPAGVADISENPSAQASPIATACVAIVAVTGLLSAMLGKIGRFVVFGFAMLASTGYAITALTSMLSPGATVWPIIALCAGIISILTIAYVGLVSASWTNSNRYARTAEAGGEEFDSAATWDALSRGDDPEPGTRAAGVEPTDPQADNDEAGEESK